MRVLTTTQILYLDTEFTSLGEPWPVQLISAAICDGHGREIFYAESDDYDPSLASSFTQERVIPLLERGDKAMPYDELSQRFFKAIENYGEPCALAADSDWDWLWVQMMALSEREARGPAMLDDPSLLPRWPDNLSPSMLRIDYGRLSRIDKLASWEASALHFKTKFPHHALVDAQGNAACARAAIESNPGLRADLPEDFCKTFKLDPACLQWTARAPRTTP